MDQDGVTAAVDEIAALLRADGGDLVLVDADPARARITLRLELDGVECLDCILAPDALAETVTQAVHRRVPEEFELVLHDPRRG
ncbi:MAG TPA: NifU family protein [Acidimicrobiia bacterium]|nr:NifU family protein [Acidimicrobiia bacterium]